MKKGTELSLNTIIIAVIVLVVLVVVVTIFSGGMNKLAHLFDQHVDDAGKEGEDATNSFQLFPCKEDVLRCRFDNLYKCTDGKWVKEEDCSNGCEKEKCN